MQGGDGWQSGTQPERPPQQPQADPWTRPPQNLHRSLLTAALQTHAVHLKHSTNVGNSVPTGYDH